MVAWEKRAQGNGNSFTVQVEVAVFPDLYCVTLSRHGDWTEVVMPHRRRSVKVPFVRQRLAVHVNLPVADFHPITGQGDDALYEVALLIPGIAEKR